MGQHLLVPNNSTTRPTRATWCTQSTRFRRIFHSFFPHSLFPLVTRWISLSLYKDQDDLRNADSENRGEERIRAAFLSFSLVRCAGLAQISLKGSSTSQGLEWTMTVSLKEASSRR